MKIIFTRLTLLLLLFTSSKLFSECVLVPLDLNERVNSATLIVEGMVKAKTARWTPDGSMIITANTIDIAKIYKGQNLLNGNSVDVITLGGQIGDKALMVNPELQLEVGQIGIFMLIMKDGQWVSESGPQGFIQIDKHTAVASDVFNTYPAFTIQSDIIGLVGAGPVNINTSLTAVTISSKRAAPTISSISPKSLNAGTSSVLTIKGTNFNTLRDTSSVQFKNGDDGGASFVKALKYDYVSWSDTMIKVMVRSQAGTGKIRVVIGNNGTANSTDTLKIAYSHLNVLRGDTISFETQEIGMNNNNGITWKMNQRFYDSSGARGAFIRSLERWRCGTYINWDTLGHLTHSAIKSDGVNMCGWDTSNAMGSGVLAQCFSWWSGCYNPNLQWFVNELDIRFRIKPTTGTNWNYTTGNASGTQFHFESVATHELGHGHQLGHVINSAVVMHYSIANGQTKPGLTANDIAGGNYVMNKSTSSICGKNAHSKLNSNNCAIVAPNVNFTLDNGLKCRNQNITFTDSSQGNISAYAWNFGANATPATAATKGPHNVVYSAGGSKNVSLTITTLNGNLVKNMTLNIAADQKMVSNFTATAAEKGKVTFTNTSSTNPIGSKWYFGDGDSSTSTNVTHTYASGGTYSVRLVSGNTCNTEDTIIPVKFAYLNFDVSPASICAEQSVVYSDSSDALVASWNWTFPGGLPNSATGKGPHSIYYASPGQKSAMLTIGVTGSNNQIYYRSNIVTVSNDTATQASFNYGYYGKNIVGFDNKSHGSNMSYKWYFGDGDSSTEKSPVHTYANANNKVVKLIVSGNCGTDDTTITLRDFTNINAIFNSYFQIKPNPANNSFRFIMSAGSTIDYAIIDMSGRTVMSGKAKDKQEVMTDELESGIYTVRISSEYGYQYLNLVISHG